MGAICEELLDNIAREHKFEEVKQLGEGGLGYCLKVTKDRAIPCVFLLFLFPEEAAQPSWGRAMRGSGLGQASKISILSAWHALMDMRTMHVTQTMRILRAGWHHARPQDQHEV